MKCKDIVCEYKKYDLETGDTYCQKEECLIDPSSKECINNNFQNLWGIRKAEKENAKNK